MSRWRLSAFERALLTERKSDLEEARAKAEVVERDGQEFKLLRLPDAYDAMLPPQLDAEVPMHRAPYEIARQAFR